jgi:hypothetical protein
MTKTFSDLNNAVNSLRKYTIQPIRINMNEDWMNLEIQKYLLVDAKGEPIKYNSRTFAGIPVEIDDTIETYELVFEDGR